MKSANGINLTMLCDFYELTMGNGYFVSGRENEITYFDIFYRSVPDDGGFAIAAGLEQIIDYVQKLHFDEEDIAYLRSRGIFDEGFLDYLRNFKFTGDIWAIPEGTPIFPREPVLTVRAPAIQAQLLETYMLLEFNHQSLIATKANRVCRAADGRAVLEFGSRRAQGIAGAVTGARAAFIHTLRSIVDIGGQRVSATDRLYLAAEMPSLIKLAKEYEDKGLVFVAASRDEMPDAPLFVQEFVQSRMPELAPYVVFAPDELAAVFQVTALPTLYFLDRKGQVVDAQRGMLSEAALRQRIERALK